MALATWWSTTLKYVLSHAGTFLRPQCTRTHQRSFARSLTGKGIRSCPQHGEGYASSSPWPLALCLPLQTPAAPPELSSVESVGSSPPKTGNQPPRGMKKPTVCKHGVLEDSKGREAGGVSGWRTGAFHQNARLTVCTFHCMAVLYVYLPCQSGPFNYSP